MDRAGRALHWRRSEQVNGRRSAAGGQGRGTGSQGAGGVIASACGCQFGAHSSQAWAAWEGGQDTMLRLPAPGPFHIPGPGIASQWLARSFPPPLPTALPLDALLPPRLPGAQPTGGCEAGVGDRWELRLAFHTTRSLVFLRHRRTWRGPRPARPTLDRCWVVWSTLPRPSPHQPPRETGLAATGSPSPRPCSAPGG